MKRLFDFLASLAGLIVLSPLLVLAAVLVRLTSPGPALFRQERMGCHFRPFFIYKFRSMVSDADRRGGPITFGNDCRITAVGHVLRKTKIDELPQLLNVLKGDMSLVGPRPEVRRYVEMFRKDYEEILQVRPGITDLASIEYRDEATVLGHAADPEKEYVEQVLPEKIRLAKEYVRRSSLWFDVKLIFLTFLEIFSNSASSAKLNAMTVPSPKHEDQ
jgi:lipopolysaccharide/colanic/teichoic acid biosynthesis glycosyltransferase